MVVTEEQYLAHHGVKGMKWGVRKAVQKVGGAIKSRRQKEANYRKKLTAISKNRSVIDTSDERRIDYRNQSLIKRVGKTAVFLALQTATDDILNGRSNMNISSKSVAKRIGSLAVKTAVNVKINDAIADSTARKYTDKGSRVKGKKARLIEKEDLMEIGVKTATTALPFAKFVLGMKMSDVIRTRAANKARFEKWGGNILSEKASDYNNLWTSDDGSMSVLERVR